MEDKCILSEKILSVLASSSTNQTPISDILSATNVPKKTLNAELQKLKRKGTVVKIQDTPPVWSLKDPNLIPQKTDTVTRRTRSKAHFDKEKAQEKSQAKNSPEKKSADVKGIMNKDLGKRIVSYLQSQGRAVKTVDIAKAVGCKTAKEINPTLYSMQKKNIVVKVTESPPTWSVTVDIPHDFQQQENNYQPMAVTQNQQNIASANTIQYPTDGSIPAFQETSLFNSDVSFDTDYSDLVTGNDNINSLMCDSFNDDNNMSLAENSTLNIPDDSLNANRGLFDEEPQNDAMSQESNNEEGDSDQMCADEKEKPSIFRTFFKLDEPMSEDSEEEVENNRSMVDKDNDIDDTNDSSVDSTHESSERLNEFTESTGMREVYKNDTEDVSDNEPDGYSCLNLNQEMDDKTAFNEQSVIKDLSPPMLDKQEVGFIEHCENSGTEKKFEENDDNEEVLPNELPEHLPLEMEEIAPSALPDQLPIDQGSDDDNVDGVDQKVSHDKYTDESFRDGNLMEAEPSSAEKKKPDVLMAEIGRVSSDENKQNNAIPCTVPLNDDCQQLLIVFNPDLPCAQFVLKNKSRLSPDRFTECLQELEDQNLIEKKGSQWQLSESGKILYRTMSGTDSSNSEEAMPLPRKRPHSRGPPPSPLALIQKEKGLEPRTSKESPLSFLKGAPKVDSFKQTANIVHNRISLSSVSAAQSNVEHLNSSLFPGAPMVTNSSSSVISGGPIPSTVNSETFNRPSNAPVPLMSLNLDNRRVTRSSNLNAAGPQNQMFRQTNTSLSGSGLFQQGMRPSVNQASGSSIFQQETGSSPSSSSALRPSSQPENRLFKAPGSAESVSVPPSTVARPSEMQISSSMAPPVTKPNKKGGDKLVIPKPPPRPGAVSSAGKPSALSQKPPLSPAEMLARGLKKTDISPPKTMDSPSVSMLSGSQNVKLNTAQRLEASVQHPQTGPQTLLGNQMSGSNFQTSGNKFGMLASNLTGMGSGQTGIRSLMSHPQTASPQSQFGLSSASLNPSGTQSGLASLHQPQGQFGLSSSNPSQRQFGSLSQQPQSTPTMRIPQPPTSGQALSLDTESFAALNKNPVSALMEYAQSRKLEARIELIGRRGASHRPTFEMAAFVGKRQFPSVHCSNKKDGKKEACDIALRQLIAEGQFNQTAQAPKPTVAPSHMTHFDKMAALTHRGFTALVSQIRSESFAGRKVIAGMVMKRSESDTGILISLGTGNRCITGQQLSLEGNTINDSHAEIITRRGFIRFLYKQLWEYDPSKNSPLFERSPRGKIQIRPNITFHLYISTAPCGDGALFSPRDEAANKAPVDTTIRPPHQPTFTSNVQGLLRTKVEGGEGTIPIEPGFKGLTFDGVQRGERLLTMSCTDKVCRWNVVGLQGALLSHFLEPVYLDSLTLGLLYDHGHLARAVCCRVARGDTDVDSLLPPGYKLNHPWLGRVTVCDPPREVQKTKALSVNWCFGDNAPEVVDGTLGLNLTSIEKQMFSRCSKRNLYDSFKKLCQKFGRQDLLSAQTYREAKEMANDFKTAKEAMLKKFKENKYGKWVSKPIEEEMFS